MVMPSEGYQKRKRRRKACPHDLRSNCQQDREFSEDLLRVT